MQSSPSRILCLATGLFITSAGSVLGESVPVTELVRLLGDPSYGERERASEAVRRLGREAVSALEEGLKASDPEIRRRCAELLPLARRTDVDIRFDAFISDTHVAAPLPGWTNFRKLAGDDRPARIFFVALGRSDRALLETLEQDPSRAGSQLGERCSRLGPRGAWRPGSTGNDGTINGLLLAAACSTDKNSTAVQQFFNTLYQPQIRSAIRESIAARRLVSPFLARQLDEPWRLHQAVWLARNLGLYEFTEEFLKPAARKQAVAAAARPDESGNLYQAASIASMLGMQDTIEATLKPAARQLAEKMCEKPDDPSHIFTAYNVLQTLNMQDTIDEVLRPAACLTIAAVAAKPYDQYRFQMALNLARSLQLNQPVEKILKPAAVRALISLSQQLPENPGQLHNALNLVQTFELKEASEDFLKPAARRLATTAAKSGDLGKLTQAAQLVTTLAIVDGADETLRGAVRKLAVEPTTDANRVTQLVSLAHDLGMKDTIDNALKPQARRALLAAKDRPIKHDIQQSLQLARTLQLKEGVPLAIKAARSQELNAWSRSNAVMFVAEFGGKEHISELEPLLYDKSSIGSMGFNFATIHTELRDVTLAAVVSLSGQSLDDYDYPYLKLFGGAGRALSALSAHCYGFADSAGRDAALNKWKERRATAKK
jgi:hypothetical protein